MKRLLVFLKRPIVFIPLLLVGGASVLLLNEVYIDGVVHEVVYFLTLFVFVFGLLRHVQIRRARTRATEEHMDQSRDEY